MTSTATQPAPSNFFAPRSSTGEFETLEPGTYPAVCIGVTTRFTPNKYKGGALEEKVRFVFQVCEGGQQFYLRTRDCALTINEKSNLYLLINSWTKAGIDRMANGFSCEKMIGFPAQLVVLQHEYNGRAYADIANVIPLKKGTSVSVTPAEIPYFLSKDAVSQQWAPGITVKPAPEAPVAAKEVNAGVYQQAPNPVASAVPDGSVNFGYVTPQPAPVPAVPQQEQAPEVDDDGDPLPF